MTLSVICPIYNEEKYIGIFLDSILRQDFPKDDLEILLVDGMSTDNTREIIHDYIKQNTFIRLIDNPNKIVPCAMNLGIEAAKGDIIMRLDAHTSYQFDYCSELVKALKRLCVDNVGTVCKTDVLNKTSKSLAIREVLRNRFGVGNSVFRTGVNKEQEVDTVPFGCWPRTVFDKYGRFDERLVRNQDIDLNKRIIRGGGHVFIIPDTYCTYYAREGFRSFAINQFNNGEWNVLTVYYTKTLSSLSVRHFVPLLFVLSIIIPLIGCVAWLPLVMVSAASLSAYLCLIGFVSTKLALQKRLSFIHLVTAFFVLHQSYGWGSFVGIIRLIYKKITPSKKINKKFGEKNYE